jgi:hypothetical protein
MAAHDALRTALEQQAEPVAREGFERWAKSLPNYMDISRFETGYSDCNIDYAWAGWQAALAQPQQQAEPPPEWPLIKNIIAEYGLDAISFVAEWKAAQRPWVGLTDEDWEKVANRKNTVLDTFEQGATWAAYKLERRNT